MKKLIIVLYALFFIACLNAQITDPFANPTILGSGMNLVAKVKINGLDASTQDILTAYVGNQLRAKTTLINFSAPVTGVGRTFLVQTVTPNETIVFKIWDYSEQRIYTANITLSSIPGGTVGSYPNNIYEINANTSGYNISGYVTHNGAPLSGLQMNCTSSNPVQSFSTFRSSITNTSGYFLIPDLISGSNATITPLSDIYEFSPETQDFSNINSDNSVNFVAQTMQTYLVSGFVAYNGSALTNVQISTGTFQTLTDLNGYYQLELPHNHSYILTASKTGYNFSPATINIATLTDNSPNNNFTASIWTYMIYGSTGTPQTLINISSTNQNVYPPVISDNQGDYQVQNILYNDTVTLNPSKEGFTFNPISRTFVNLQANTAFNFIAEQIMYTLSGTITLNNLPLDNVIINYGSGNTLTDVNGQYSFSLPWHSNVSIIPSKIGYRFSPTQVSYNNLEQNQLSNFTATALAQYTVSGYVRKTDNSPLINCQVSIGTASNLTDLNGYYTLTLYESDQPLQIIPSKTGYSFIPAQIDLSNLTQNLINQNFTANPALYSISGNVSGAPSVLLTLSGDVANTIVSDANGNYSFLNIPYESNVTITPSKAHYHFNPTLINLPSVSGNNLNQNFIAEIDSYPVNINVTDSGNPLSNTQITYNGNIAYTDVNGNFSFILNHGSSCSVSVFKSNYFFVQNEIIINNISQAQTLNFITRPANIFTVSGTVNYAQTALDECLIQTNAGNVYTNALGQYSLNVIEGTNLSVIPSKTGYDFDPSYKVYNYLNQNESQNFTASLKPVILSGYIYYNNQPLSGIKIKCQNDSVYTNLNGMFTFTVPYFSNVLIYPEDPAYTCSPANYSIINANQDLDNLVFNAQEKVYYVSGLITYNGNALSGVVVHSSLDNDNYTTNELGLYQVPLHYQDSCVLRPVLSSYIFNPDSLQISNINADSNNNDFIALAKVLPVQFSLVSGVYYTPQSLELSCATSDVQIYYTLNGQEPDNNSLFYTTPISLPLNSYTVIKSRAYKLGFIASDCTSAYYNITGVLDAPTCSHASLIYNTAILVALNSEANTQIRYTKNGLDPSESDSLYYQALYINTPCILKAKAFRTNYQSSPVISRDFTFNHLLSLSLPDTLIINQNNEILINLRNYLSDSISGNHFYNVELSQPEHLNLTLNNLQINLSPEANWYGSDVLHITINWENTNFCSDSMLIKIIPDNYPPVIVNYMPADTVLSIHPPHLQDFIVNASDVDDPVFYKWYVNNSVQNIQTNSFQYLFDDLGNYSVKCEITDLNSTISVNWQIHSSSSLENINELPVRNQLYQNYPNPFVNNTNILFSIVKDENLSIDIYDVRGRLVRNLVNKSMNNGKHIIVWDGKNNHGKDLPNGIYLYKIHSENFNATRKAILLKQR